MNKITLRTIQKKDFSRIQKMIKQAWKYEEMSSPKTADHMAKAFLSSCVCNQTFTAVAVNAQDQAIGVIMGNDRKHHHCPLKYRIRQIQSILSLFLHKEGRRIAMMFKDISVIDSELLKESKMEYDGEIAFFVMDEAYRGKGIGKQLFIALQEYMKNANVEKYFLYTDTSCNYPFYEHQGLIRRGEKEHAFHINGQKAIMSFFIYDNLNDL